MKKKIFKFSWPEGLNLQILEGVLSEEDFIKVVVAFMNKPRAERRIVLPSLRCCRKVWAHNIWSRIKAGEMTWERYKKSLRKEFGSMAFVGIKKDRIIKLYRQRKKEIENEKS